MNVAVSEDKIDVFRFGPKVGAEKVDIREFLWYSKKQNFYGCDYEECCLQAQMGDDEYSQRLSGR
jgi:hypothetical protein